jgi:hypothetical protein
MTSTGSMTPNDRRYRKFEPGTRVRILWGAYEGLHGTVDTLTIGKLVAVNVDGFGRYLWEGQGLEALTVLDLLAEVAG